MIQTTQLLWMRDKIERMNKDQQLVVLRILHEHSACLLNENKNGIHVNLSEVSSDVLHRLLGYVEYVSAVETALQDTESKKNEYRHLMREE